MSMRMAGACDVVPHLDALDYPVARQLQRLEERLVLKLVAQQGAGQQAHMLIRCQEGPTMALQAALVEEQGWGAVRVHLARMHRKADVDGEKTCPRCFASSVVTTAILPTCAQTPTGQAIEVEWNAGTEVRRA